MACCEAASSASDSTDFMARNFPPGFTSGRHSSHSTGRAATARETAKSKVSRCSAANSSARAWTQATSGRSSSRHTVSRNWMRLFRESSSVRRMEGSSTRRGRPGKPAPVPTSTTDFPEKDSRVSRAALSKKWRVATSSGSVMAVRFITLLVSISRSPYRTRAGIPSTGRFRAARPDCRRCSIMSSPSAGLGSPPAALPPARAGAGEEERPPSFGGSG